MHNPARRVFAPVWNASPAIGASRTQTLSDGGFSSRHISLPPPRNLMTEHSDGVLFGNLLLVQGYTESGHLRTHRYLAGEEIKMRLRLHDVSVQLKIKKKAGVRYSELGLRSQLLCELSITSVVNPAPLF